MPQAGQPCPANVVRVAARVTTPACASKKRPRLLRIGPHREVQTYLSFQAHPLRQGCANRFGSFTEQRVCLRENHLEAISVANATYRKRIPISEMRVTTATPAPVRAGSRSARDERLREHGGNDFPRSASPFLHRAGTISSPRSAPVYRNTACHFDADSDSAALYRRGRCWRI